jgi:PAS domain S-box-containing protein
MKSLIEISPQNTDEFIPEYGDNAAYQNIMADSSVRKSKASSGKTQYDQRRVLDAISAGVADQMLAGAELRDSKEHYRAIIDAFDGQIYICSQDYRILFMNEKLIERTGSNAVGESCFKALHNLETICPWCKNERVFGGETVKWEIRSPKDNRWFYVVNTPIHNEDGTVSKQAMIQDITDRKLAEESVRINEARQRAMIENIVDVIAIIDQDGIISYKSPNVEKWFGWKPEELIGESAWNTVHPDDLENIRKLFADVLSEVNVSKTAECRLRCKDDSYKWIKINATNLLHNHEIAGILLSYHDISERIRAEEERQVLEQQFHYAQKLESLGVLASGIAHDFNNILTVILGHCHMAREYILPDHDYKISFEKIASAGNRAADLCQQMLIYAGKSPLVQTRVNLWFLVDEVVKMLCSAINKNVTINLELGSDIPEIKGDSGQLQQIVMNLIINASEAIGNDMGIVTVVLSKSEFKENQTVTDMFGKNIVAGRYVCLEVRDTGSGMSEETRLQIFEPFYTTKTTGHGLGMSAIRGIVTSHKGILQLTSAPGVGTTFKVFFPVQEQPDHAETISTASAPGARAAGTILLVEDDKPLLDMGTVLLELMGFTPLTALNGQEALEIFQNRCNDIDLILLDLIMPVMGGIRTYHELRKTDSLTPIIICSGYGVELVEDVIKDDVHAEFMHKPYNPDKLRDVMMKMIGHNNS